jgi:lipoprotein-releasing system permease protein
MSPPVQVTFSLLLALRYLRPKRSFVSAITVISLCGVMLGVAVLIIVISVMTGFDRTLQRAILGFEPHLKVVNGEVLRDWREILPQIDKVPGVLGAAPYVQGPVLIEHEGRVNPAIVRGINLDQERKLIDLDKYIGGSIDMESDTVILGRTLAADLGASVGDEVIIYAPGNIRGILDELRRTSDDPDAKPKTLADIKQDVVIPAPMKVVGLINSGTNAFDANFILTPLHNAQELYGLKDGVHGLAVKTDNPYGVRAVQDRIHDVLEGRAFSVSWIDDNQQRFDAIRMERHVMFVLLSVIVLVAAFGIMNTLITVTVQKTREIGIMKALGARTSQIVWVFLGQGMVVGATGTLLGLGAGLLLIYFRNPFRNWLGDVLGIEIFPAGIYEFDGIPAEIIPQDVAIICIGAFVLCSVAALIPAYLAARLDPVKALRTE